MYRHEVSSVRSVDQASADSGQAGSGLDDSPLTTSMCRFASRHADHPATVNFSSTLPSYRRCTYACFD